MAVMAYSSQWYRSLTKGNTFSKYPSDIQVSNALQHYESIDLQLDLYGCIMTNTDLVVMLQI
jgi:hypothetical protein